MCAMQRNPYPNPPWNQVPQPPPQQPPPPPDRFRWPLYFWLPVVLAAFFWFLSGMDVAFSFSDIMQSLQVRNTERYELLAALGVLCVTILLIVKILKNK